MAEDPHTARMVAEDLLVRTGEAMLAGNFDAFRQCFLLPNEIELFDGTNLIETIEDQRAVFDSVRAFHARRGVTQIVRRCVEADFLDADTIASTHVASLLRGNELLQPTYPVYSILRRVDGVWRIAHGKYAIADAPDLDRALAVKADGSTG